MVVIECLEVVMGCLWTSRACLEQVMVVLMLLWWFVWWL